MTTGYKKHNIQEMIVSKWQSTIDVVADIFEVPAALIMRVWPEQIEVLVKSSGVGNPYTKGELADLGTGLYCETVMSTRSQLHVPNALDEKKWQNNPDVKLNMINYLGIPLIWPDNTIFGTICVLDSKTRHYETKYERLLWEMKKIIQADLELARSTEEKIEEILALREKTQKQY